MKEAAMSRAILALLVGALCVLVTGCFKAEFDPGIRVRRPRTRVKLR